MHSSGGGSVEMAHAKVAEVALIAGVVGALISAALPSPTTIVKFKPWKDPDAAVRFTFWLSLGTAGGLGVFFFLGMRERGFSGFIIFFYFSAEPFVPLFMLYTCHTR